MTVYGWENDRHPPQRLALARVARALGISVESLLGKEALTFGEQLQIHRLKGGYTQKALGRRLGLTRGRISAWERNIGRPSEAQWRRLEQILGAVFKAE